MRRKAIPGPPRLSHAATAARSLQPAPEEAPAHTGSPLASPLPSAKLQSTLALGPSRTPLALKPRQPAARCPVHLHAQSFKSAAGHATITLTAVPAAPRLGCSNRPSA